MKIEIAEAEGRDLPGITAIYNDAVLRSVATFDTEPRSDEGQRAWLRSHDERHPVIVARAAGEVVGWASLNEFLPKAAYAATVEDSVYVKEGWQRRGIGRLLLARLIEMARERGHHAIVARIADHMTASIALHKALGFVEAGDLREVGRKFDRWIDVTLMELTLAG